jgi:ribosomal protein S18 acetylase RimI-like enzyme
MSPVPLALRPASPRDAETIAALSIQVFLDTYATEGVRPDLAEEAFVEYSVEAFAARLREPHRRFILAETGTGLVGYSEVLANEAAAPAGGVMGSQLVRLYVQPSMQGSGVGKALIASAERIASERSKALWLIAWERNDRALAFYARRGYEDVGADTYTFRDQTYGTRVLAKRIMKITSVR